MSNQEWLDLEQKLQARNYRLTKPRKIIWQGLIDSGGHLTADQLADYLHENGNPIGRMTIYRTLDLFAELGVIRPIYHGSGAAHYIRLHDGHHHHIVCTQCHTVIELADCRVSDYAKHLAKKFEIELIGHLVEFYGICKACKVGGQ